jgi:hypothetical protein
MILIVAFNLRPAGTTGEAIREICATAGDSSFWLWESVWLLDTEQQPMWWRDRLRERGSQRDQIFVGRLQRRWGALQLDAATEWLTDPARRW